jgi:hypothetical protein
MAAVEHGLELSCGLGAAEMRLLDLFCGRWGWSRAFAARGWECVGIDLVEPSEIPVNCTFARCDVLNMSASGGRIGVNAQIYGWLFSWKPDFICASSPCEQFSVFGMKHFHPNPPFPELGIKLFNYTRQLCEVSGIPYVMENVRCAQQFVGNAKHHAGPFYLWGSAVPPLLNVGIKKGWGSKWIDSQGRVRDQGPAGRAQRTGLKGVAGSKLRTAQVATIPIELANCVADYAERLLEQRRSVPAAGI